MKTKRQQQKSDINNWAIVLDDLLILRRHGAYKRCCEIWGKISHRQQMVIYIINQSVQHAEKYNKTRHNLKLFVLLCDMVARLSYL